MTTADDIAAAFEAVFGRPLDDRPRRPLTTEQQRAIDRAETIAEDRARDEWVSEDEIERRENRYEQHLDQMGGSA